MPCQRSAQKEPDPYFKSTKKRKESIHKVLFTEDMQVSAIAIT